MKKLVTVIFVLVLAVSAFQSCSKDKTQTPSPTVCDSTVTYSYTANVKAVFDSHCTGCHNDIIANGGVRLHDFNTAKQATQNGKVICTMRYTCSPAMPPTGKISDAEIAIVECWANNGFLN